MNPQAVSNLCEFLFFVSFFTLLYTNKDILKTKKVDIPQSRVKKNTKGVNEDQQHFGYPAL